MTRIAYIIIVISIVACAYYYYYYNISRLHAGSMCTICCSNLKIMGMALDQYAKKNNGKYPDDLQKLIPIYLDKIPKCPAGRYSMYSRYEYMHSINPEAYTVYCRGDFHTPMWNHNCPQYFTIEGQEGDWKY